MRSLLLTAMLGLALPIPATGSTPTPSPTAPPMPADVCPVAPIAIEALDGPERKTEGDLFSVILSSPDGPGRVSGSMWINTSAGPFHVIFRDRVALSSQLKGPVDAIAFRLPVKAKLFDAFIDELDLPTPGPCPIFNVWTPAITRYMKNEVVTMLRSSTTDLPIEAEPITDPAAACKVPNANLPPRTIHLATPESEIDEVNGRGTEVLVNVLLGEDSELHDPTIAWTGNLQYNKDALEATRKSILQTAIKMCRPVQTLFRFEIHFRD